jgi:hypothetical protein
MDFLKNINWKAVSLGMILGFGFSFYQIEKDHSKAMDKLERNFACELFTHSLLKEEIEGFGTTYNGMGDFEIPYVILKDGSVRGKKTEGNVHQNICP